jgi:hypothetical protein
MEFIFEIILELIGTVACEASKSSRIPRPVRLILAAVIMLFYIAVIAVIFLAGVLMLKESIIGSIFLFALGLFILIMSIKKFRSTYLHR